MQLSNHTFKEDFNEWKLIVLSNKKSFIIQSSISGASQCCVRNRNFYFNSMELAYNPLYISTSELAKYCSYLNEMILDKTNNKVNVRIHATFFSRKIDVLKNLKQPSSFSTQYHGRLFCEVSSPNGANSVIDDVGISAINQSNFFEDWWQHINCNHFLKLPARLTKVIDSKKIAPGKYDIILTPEAAIQLVHEVFGHLFETDYFLENKHNLLQALSKSSFDLDVYDDPTIKGSFGFFDIDDYGQQQKRTNLIVKGQLTNSSVPFLKRSHYFDPLLYRVSNTCLSSGKKTLNDLISSVKKGVLISSISQCYCDPVVGSVILPILEAAMIENGQCIYPVGKSMIYTNIDEVINSIEGLGNDFKLKGIMCGKVSQKIPVGAGSPSILLRNILLR